jgi:hypothetical protein
MYEGLIEPSKKNNAAIAALNDLNEGAKWVQITIAQQKELEKVLSNSKFEFEPIKSISGVENFEVNEFAKKQKIKVGYSANDGVEDYSVDWLLDSNLHYSGMFFAQDTVKVNKNAVTALKQLGSPGIVSLSVKVNKSFEENENLPKKQAIRRALQMARAWKEILPSLPEGAVVHNSPLGGKGGKRERFYRGNGFGAVGASGQYGIVVIEEGEKVVKPILLDRYTND